MPHLSVELFDVLSVVPNWKEVDEFVGLAAGPHELGRRFLSEIFVDDSAVIHGRLHGGPALGVPANDAGAGHGVAHLVLVLWEPALTEPGLRTGIQKEQG